MPTAVVVVAALLAISIGAYAYASSGGGTEAPSPCQRVEVGVSDCLADRSLARTSHRSVGTARSIEAPLLRQRHRARLIGVPVDCNGICPKQREQALVEATTAAAAARKDSPAGAKAGSTAQATGSAEAGATAEKTTASPETSVSKPVEGGESEGTEAETEGTEAEGSASETEATEPEAEGTEVEGAESEAEGTEPETEGAGSEAGGVPPLETPCALGGASAATISMYTTDCPLYASDLATVESPLSFWGEIDCASANRYAYVEGGGDPHLSATGEKSDGNYRRVTVLDGDNADGERCELGENSVTGPTAFYHEDENVLTYFSERLPSNFPLNTQNWQVTMQMKQAQTSHDDGSGVALEMEVRDGRWIVSDLWHEVFSFPAKAETWTRFAWDVYYSKNPEKGWVQVSADLNGDGDFNDPGERSPVIHAATLATELPEYAAADGIPAGSGIPSHLRMGIYHDPAIPCPAPTGCSVDVDNVQVIRPTS